MSSTILSITEINDFFTIDYNLIYSNNSFENKIFSKFVNPLIPVCTIIIYLSLSRIIFKYIRKTFYIQPKSSELQCLTIMHSLLLAIYSIWTFISSIKIIIPILIHKGLYGMLCDSSITLWEQKNLGFWITHFYISKYYELLDTWIIILKGRSPMVLQTFHHAGIILCMWGLMITRHSACGTIMVCLNSFIHSIMYLYYTFAAFGYHSKLKVYLTQAQIIQFLVGIIITVPQHFIPHCINQAQQLVLLIIQLYVIVLLVLFYQFYKLRYIKSIKQQ